MKFVLRAWDKFCKELHTRDIHSITARDVLNRQSQDRFLVLKHDVETNVKRAYRIACIESQYAHCSSFYVQAYLLKDKRNVQLLQNMQDMGHEISYHYDVMDFCGGNVVAAEREFAKNSELFKTNGFLISTVCQHGNPIIKREGYTSNRDFFRNATIQKKYAHIADIMVDFPDKANVDYLYFSDAGQRFKQIYDPINNDVTPSEDKDILYENIADIQPVLDQRSAIISTHPHRWYRFSIAYYMNRSFFNIAKMIAKSARKIPFFERLMSRYFYLAKKI